MKSLLNISDISREDLIKILDYSKKLNINSENFLKNKNIGLIFEKQSTRTRLSFQVGVKQLQGNYIDIKLEELNLDRFETYEDTFEVMSCYLDCLVFRTTSHEKLELALNYFRKPVINGLSNRSHPCQAISDIYTLQEYFGELNNLNIVWTGDINNVLFSLMEIIKILGNINLDIFTNKKIYNKFENSIPISNKINFHFHLEEKVLNLAHCVMTDVFNSMNDNDNDNDNKEILLKEFQVNEKLMSLTKNNSVFMHCLPAKIGSEVTEDVIKGKKSIVLTQAKNRLVAQKGILKWLNI